MLTGGYVEAGRRVLLGGRPGKLRARGVAWG